MEEWPALFPDVSLLPDIPVSVDLSAKTFVNASQRAHEYTLARRRLSDPTLRHFRDVADPAYDAMLRIVTECDTAFTGVLKDYGGPAPGSRTRGKLIFMWYSILGGHGQGRYMTSNVDGRAGDTGLVGNLCFHTTVIWFELLMLRTLHAAMLTAKNDAKSIEHAMSIWLHNARVILVKSWPEYCRFAPGVVAAKMSDSKHEDYIGHRHAMLPELLQETHFAMAAFCRYKLYRLQHIPLEPTPGYFHALGDLRLAVHLLDLGSTNSRVRAAYRMFGDTLNDEICAEDAGLTMNVHDLYTMHRMFEIQESKNPDRDETEFLHHYHIHDSWFSKVKESSVQTITRAWNFIHWIGEKLNMVAPPELLVPPSVIEAESALIARVRETMDIWMTTFEDVKIHPGVFPPGGLFVGSTGAALVRDNQDMTCHVLAKTMFSVLYQTEKRLTEEYNQAQHSMLIYSTPLLISAIFHILYPWSMHGIRTFRARLRERVPDADTIQFVAHPKNIVGIYVAEGEPITHVLGWLYEPGVWTALEHHESSITARCDQ